MKHKAKIAIALAAIVSATAANATILTFDTLHGQYGDGSALGANMTQTADGLRYVDSGYVYTLYTPGTNPVRAHIGDAGPDQTFNWHDSGRNGLFSYVTLTALHGGRFDLINFDYAGFDGLGLTISAAGYADHLVNVDGNVSVNFHDVSLVTFSSDGGTNNALDNIQLDGDVPEPGSFALIAAGLVGAGVLRHKKTRQ
jgi:hypothetical protein